ncbi:O-antigen ligase family protein [Carboxydochorda subterranea]|uniref:O-antigen ligase family protein n=1 Tax=Carboxydichorda subterranea TaxID=3109565 RepID=A0ABZ1C1K3_9FIRM|nr:O-antigen ligase family protein [Limnochorda sp. L945t]WRP18829.1 O-antigen ligase family protein [Limnochorda sp. L945t]
MVPAYAPAVNPERLPGALIQAHRSIASLLLSAGMLTSPLALTGYQIAVGLWRIDVYEIFIGLSLVAIALYPRIRIKSPVLISGATLYMIALANTLLAISSQGGFSGVDITPVMKWTLSLLPLYLGYNVASPTAFVRLRRLLPLATSIAGLVVLWNAVSTGGSFTAFNRSEGFRLHAEPVSPNETGELLALVSLLLIASSDVPLGIRIAGLLINGGLLVLTFSRESLVTLSLGLVVMGMLNRRQAFYVILMALALPYAWPWLWNEVASQPDITNGRLLVWRSAFDAVGERPFFFLVRGLGYGQAPPIQGGNPWAHNMLLEALMVGGVPALITLIAFLAGIGHGLWKSASGQKGEQSSLRCEAARALLSFFLAYVITGAVADHLWTFWIVNTAFLGLIGMVLRMSAESRHGKARTAIYGIGDR